MNKRKLYGTLIGVIAFAILIAGATFAWFTYVFNATNGSYNAATTCFDIIYEQGQDINGELLFTENASESRNQTSIVMGINTNCNIDAVGKIELYVSDETSPALLETVSPHCENHIDYSVGYISPEQSLVTDYELSNQTACEQNNKVWVTNGTALKYAVVYLGNVRAEGYINQTGLITLYDGFFMTRWESLPSINSPQRRFGTYTIIVWLDGEVANESHMDTTFSGYIRAEETQKSTANPPDLLEGLIPVKLSNDGDTVTATTATDPDWYKYEYDNWANAVLVEESGIQTRTGNSRPGNVIDPSDILAYYVWIPRYSYKVWQYTGVSNRGREHEIEIKFVPTSVKETATKNGEWQTHPAFTFGDKELAGIWVGKFETSHTTLSSSTTDNSLGDDYTRPACKSTGCENYAGLRVLPNVRSLRYNRTSNFFYASRFMESTGNPFGLNADTVDSHMMKNSEWGAVAYLAHSEYGINTEIGYNNQNTYTTGCGNNIEVTGTCYNSYGTVTTYPQSTTGNATGVFDMAGGSWERVMAHWGDTTTYGAESGFSSTNPLPDAKYYDNYSSTQFANGYWTNYDACTLATCGGHALNETKNWYNDFDHFVLTEYVWASRGGDYGGGETAGIFASHNSNGHTSYGATFRSVLVKE